MTLISALGSRADPPLNHNFIVSLLDSPSTLAGVSPPPTATVRDHAVGGFTECSGLEMSMQPEEYKEGGRNGAVLKFANRITWSNLSLKKGICIGTALWDWQYAFVLGQGQRRDGMIVLLNEKHEAAAGWYFRRGLPIKYTGPSMNSTQNTVAIEAIEIAHEGLYQMPGIGPSGTAAGAIGGSVG